MRPFLAALLIALPLPLLADAQLAAIRDSHIRPGFDALAEQSAALAAQAQADCAPDSAALRGALGTAWDAWIAVSHLRFGPSEADNRAFYLGFWPDTRGKVPKTLAGLIAAEDGAVADPAAFAEVSVAARGFTALEFLLYEPSLAQPSPYHCALVKAVARDIAATSAAIAAEWQGDYGADFAAPGPEAPFGSVTEAKAALYTALLTGLEFTRDARLGRPMGSFERPRPKRAEAWRAGRSARHVGLSVAGTGALAASLAQGLPGAEAMAASFARAGAKAAGLEASDPGFAGVATPGGRLAVEALQQRVNEADQAARTVIGPGLGLAQGFNSMDGD